MCWCQKLQEEAPGLLVEKVGLLLQKRKLHNCLSVLISKVSHNPSYVRDGEASGDFSSRSVTFPPNQGITVECGLADIKKKKNLTLKMTIFICYPSGPGASKSQPILDTAKQDPNGCFLN